MKKQKSDGRGALYFSGTETYQSDPSEQYFFRAYSGKHEIEIQAGDCCFYLSDNGKEARVLRGPARLKSKHFATVVRGYAPPNRSVEILSTTNLPYINGCSTRQLIHPERSGDPTWQMLKMPPWVKEQKHHIHATARAVYVLKGEGLSVVGTSGRTTKHKLLPGMVCVLEPMCPHHFETQDDELIVLPVHIWSSIPGHDFNHPMFNGTFAIE